MYCEMQYKWIFFSGETKEKSDWSGKISLFGICLKSSRSILRRLVVQCGWQLSENIFKRN